MLDPSAAVSLLYLTKGNPVCPEKFSIKLVNVIRIFKFTHPKSQV